MATDPRIAAMIKIIYCDVDTTTIRQTIEQINPDISVLGRHMLGPTYYSHQPSAQEVLDAKAAKDRLRQQTQQTPSLAGNVHGRSETTETTETTERDTKRQKTTEFLQYLNPFNWFSK